MNQKISDERVIGNKRGRATIFVTALLFLTIFTVAGNNLVINNVSAVSPIVRVQGVAQGTSPGALVFTVTLGAPPTSGNVVVLTVSAVSGGAPAPTVSSVTETGVTWSMVVAQQNINVDSEIWYGVVGAGASTTITVSLSKLVTEAIADACEYSGLASSPLDKFASTSGTTATTSTGTTATTTDPNELLVGSVAAVIAPSTYQPQTSATNGFTLVDGTTIASVSEAYLENIVSSKGAYVSGTTLPSGTTYTWAGAIAAFEAISQVTMTVSYSVTGGGVGYTAPWFNYFFGGVAQNYQLTTTGVAKSVDKGSTWTVSQTSGGGASDLLGGSSGTEQWITSHSVTGTASAGTIVFNYQNQYSLTMIISPSGGGTTTPTGSLSPGTSTWENAAAFVTITATNNIGYTFAGWTGSGAGHYTGSTNPSSVTMNAAITETANFVAQVTMTVSYSVSGGGTLTTVGCPTPAAGDYCAPWFNYVSLGVTKHVKLTTTATGYLVDSGSSWTVSRASGGPASAALGGSSSTERWYTTQTDSGTASAATIVFAYQHQYFLTMIAFGAGTVTPVSKWVNKGAVVTIKATPTLGHVFIVWIGSGTGSYSGGGATQTITMNSAITETGEFL